ncbi:ubiquinol-cytochrome C chaperone family protein [Tsuneonella troitsensis]|uniref:ubiquinol-cytochrome C chaperone family protein n=1 Tax=Tsuneonella troitsensis TaxID=292222 RepID=UPI00070F0392|nr:ubiquinol-cytochrome C chaperone family protein [Tsuneonella troitsensis]
MSLLSRLFASRPDPREALRPLWNAVITEARRPAWYADHGVNDTVAGRFDMVCAVLAAVLVRMETIGTMTNESVLLTELFVHDMDGQLREFGVGDVVVGKHVTKLMGAMGGRLTAYRDGLSGDDAALFAAVARNVSLREGADPAAVASELRAFAARLSITPDTALLAGEIAP